MLASILSSIRKRGDPAAAKVRSAVKKASESGARAQGALARAGTKARRQGSEVAAAAKRAAGKALALAPAKRRAVPASGTASGKASGKASSKATATASAMGRSPDVVKRMTRQMASQHAQHAQHTLPVSAARRTAARRAAAPAMHGGFDSCGSTPPSINLTTAQSSQFGVGEPYAFANPSPSNNILNSVTPSVLAARGEDTTDYTGEGLLRSSSYSAVEYSGGGAGRGRSTRGARGRAGSALR